MATLGLLQLVASTTAWSWPHPKLFLLYLFMASVCSLLQLKSSGRTAFSANVPVLLLSISQLSLPEAVVVGAVAALSQGLSNRNTRRHPLHLALNAGVLASVIATAEFAYGFVPNSVQSPTLRLLAASMALFFANTFPAAIASRENKQQRLGQVWKESYFWLVPYYVVSAAVASTLIAAASGSISLQTTLLVLPAVYMAYRYYRVQKAQLETKERNAENMAALHLRAIEGLALAVEAKDNLNTRGHLRRVRVYAVGIGKALGLSATDIEALQAGALLHDIGKLAVPEYILTKPGKLTPEEFAKMKVHPIVGAEIVEQVQFPYPVAPIVRAHHEKWDGSGYPFGLKGEDIPIGARILTAVDYFDALASDREYRRALPLEEAMHRVEAEAGKGLDPKVVEVFRGLYLELEQMAKATENQTVTLSSNVRIERGQAPDSGLDLWALSGLTDQGSDFVGSIAAVGQEQKALIALSEGIVSLDLDEILQRVQSGLLPLIPYDAMAIFVAQGDTLIAQRAVGENKAMLSALEVRAGDGLVGWVAQNQQPIVNGNPAVDAGFQCAEGFPLEAALAAPFKGSAGLVGVLAFYRRDRDSFTRDHLRILTDIAPRIAAAIENALKIQEIQENASIDWVTGLPHVRAAMQALDVELIRAKRHKQHIAVVVVEFSGVSALKPELGQPDPHSALRSLARGLRDGCRQYDHVARTGDDKFTLILPGMKRVDINYKLEMVQANALSTFQQLLSDGTIGFAIGEAYYPDDADTAKLLMAIAEGRKAARTIDVSASLTALHAHNRKEQEPARPPDVEVAESQ
jgi:diguanylate cyclase (GGDEF)-like protein/putative nucleotidyltransferase with HDIG domain